MGREAAEGRVHRPHPPDQRWLRRSYGYRPEEGLGPDAGPAEGHAVGPGQRGVQEVAGELGPGIGCHYGCQAQLGEGPSMQQAMIERGEKAMSGTDPAL